MKSRLRFTDSKERTKSHRVYCHVVLRTEGNKCVAEYFFLYFYSCFLPVMIFVATGSFETLREMESLIFSNSTYTYFHFMRRLILLLLDIPTKKFHLLIFYFKIVLLFHVPTFYVVQRKHERLFA